jgi:hypothetical protein
VEVQLVTGGLVRDHPSRSTRRAVRLAYQFDSPGAMALSGHDLFVADYAGGEGQWLTELQV